MALVTCPECGASVSDTAATCPHCGYALDRTARAEPGLERVDRGPSIAGPILIIVLLLLLAGFAAWYMGIIRIR